MTPEQEQALTLLMAASQRGDREAYDALLRQLRDIVSRYVRHRVGPAAWAEDVTQDVLLSIHRARHTWNPERPFVPWLYAVVRSRLVDAIRRHRRTAAGEEPVDVVPDVVWQAAPDAAVIARTDLAQAMGTLSPTARGVIERLKLEELSVRQVASEMGLSESNVKVIAHRGYAALRRVLTGKGYEE